jgi:predicted RNA-binding protein YlqC (UPF0109 family)
VSAFDDEFGLFGDDEATPEEERKSTLGARQIATNDSFSDDIEPEDERPARRRPGASGPRTGGGDRRPYHDRDRGPRPAGDPAVAQARAVELLTFLAKRLVSQPEDVIVSVVDGSRGPIIELEVHPEDFGKVIGKGGRVAQALRTIVRASAEGKVTIDIVDVEDDDPSSSSGQARQREADLEHAGDTSEPEVADAVAAAPEDSDEAVTPKKKTAAKKSAAKKTPARKKASAAAAPKRKKKS